MKEGKMKLFKKSLSLLLTTLMVLSLIPMTSFANTVPAAEVVGNVQTYTTADTAKEVKLRLNLGQFIDLNEGKVLFELTNAKLAKTTGIATASLTQGSLSKTSPDLAFVNASGTALTGGEDFFSLDVNSKTVSNNKDNIEIIITLKLDFADSKGGDVTLKLQDVGKDGKLTGIGDHSGLKVAVEQPEASDMALRVDKASTTMGPAGGFLSSVLITQFGKLSDTAAENTLTISLPTGFIFSPSTKVASDVSTLKTSYSTDKSDLIISNIPKNTAYIKIDPYVILQASNSASNGKITAGFTLRANNRVVTQKDAVIGELLQYGLTLSAKEVGKKEIPSLTKGMPKSVELTINAVSGTLTNGALINLDVEGAEILYNTIKVVEPAGLTLTASRSAGVNNKVSGYEVYLSNDFSVRTTSFDVKTIKLTFDIVAEEKTNATAATITASTSRVEDQKINIAKIAKALEVAITPSKVDKGIITDLPKVVIKETDVNLLQRGDKLYLELVYPNSDRDKGESIAFNSAKEIKIATTNSLKVDSIEVGSQENILVLTIGSRSYDGAGTIELTGIKGYLTEKALTNQVNLQVSINSAVEVSAPFFSIGNPVSLKTLFVIGSKSYSVNGQTKTLVTAPYIKEGRTMLPVRAVGESLGLEASWDNTTKTATFSNAEKTAIVKIGQSTITVNNTPVALSAPAEIKDGSTMIELRSLATAFGVNIQWDSATKTVTVN